MSSPIDSLSSLWPAPKVTELPERIDSAGGFVDKFGQLIDDTNTKINSANLEVQKLAVGKSDSLHGVMIAIESAKESLSVVVQIRNRLVDAYQEILKMQI